ncbi:MAG: short chain dehydrogenase family protein, partial [Rhizobacter sp.]|nr:short chain dehydrogenase family protein [Rhizobacter sp.]
MSLVDLEGKVAIVTGSGQGIGADIARGLAKHGARVVVLDRDGEQARAVARELGALAVACEADVTNDADLARAVALAQSTFGALDIVVN